MWWWHSIYPNIGPQRELDNTSMPIKASITKNSHERTGLEQVMSTTSQIFRKSNNIGSTHPHTHAHTFLPSVWLPLHCHATPLKGGEQTCFTCLVGLAIMDRQPSTTLKPMMACCTLYCSTLLIHRFLLLWDTNVMLHVTFTSKGSFALITLHLIVWMFLGFLVVTGNTQALQSLPVCYFPPWPRYWGFVIPPVFQYINCLYVFSSYICPPQPHLDRIVLINSETNLWGVMIRHPGHMAQPLTAVLHHHQCSCL